ncbi:MAG: glycoside hydrolase family 95 protein, partial [Sphingobium sp.]
MALTRRGLLALLPAGLVAGVVRARPAQRPRQRLWYRAPASAWTEALPVGNGRIGAMIFGGIGQERLQLNEDSFWSGAPYDPVNPQALGAMAEMRRRIFAGDIAGAEALADAKVMAQPLSQAAYQTLGSLLIEMSGAKGDPTGYERSLDLDTGLAETLFTIAGVTYRRRVVACPVNQVIAVHLSASRGGMINCRLAWDQVGADWS